MNYNSTIDSSRDGYPDDIITSMQRLLVALEERTDGKYEITIHKQGTASNNDYKIGSLKKRNKFIVYDMVLDTDKDKFLERHKSCDIEKLNILKDLAGEYNSPESIKKKLVQLYKKSLGENWTCPKCDSPKINKGCIGRCKNGCLLERNMFDHIEISIGSGGIYYSDGGSVSIYHTLGYIKIA